MIQRLGHIVLYVQDVPAAMSFYQQAFGFAQRKRFDNGQYGELETGSNVLAFAHPSVVEAHVGWQPKACLGLDPPGRMELSFETDNILSDFQRALSAGACSLAHPQLVPWGQIVAFLQDPHGVTIELCQASAAKNPMDQL